MMATPGETPGSGVYECTYCARQLELRRGGTVLPPCHRCQRGENARYRRVRDV